MEHKSHGTSSPSASSAFLPLGRRGSRASLATTRTERDNMNAALDQIHSTAYQSDSLTLFNDFTSPPAPVSAEDKGLSEEIQGGLSGLYSRFRTSVGGMRDIVSGGAKSTDKGVAEIPAVKSPSSERSMTKSASDLADHLPSHPTSSQGSRLHSPVVANFQHGQDVAPQPATGKSPKVSSKTPSISSKDSVSASPGIKPNITPLTKSSGSSTAADPAITQLHVNALGQARRSRSSSVSGPQGLKNPESSSIGSRDGPIDMPISQSSSFLNHNLAHSPVLSTKTQDSFHEENDPQGDSGAFAAAGQDHKPRKSGSSDLPRLSDVSLPGVSNTDSEISTATVLQSQEKGSNSKISTGHEKSLVPGTSLNKHPKSTTHESASNHAETAPNNHGGFPEGKLMKEEPAASVPPKPNDWQNQSTSRNRLPGYALSRTSTADTTTTISSLPPLNTAIERVPSPIPEDYRYPVAGGDGVVPQSRSKLLSKDFWMRDESAKDCFHCGEPFTTFRRKHHCRTCGQIFDSKCTSLTPGSRFNQPGSIRVCKPCEAMINAHEDDSSEFSDSEQSPIVVNPRVADLSWHNSARPSVDDDDSSSVVSQSIDQVLKTPTMAIPATRLTGDGNNRRSAVLEINSDRPLARPTSSRSLRSSLGGRPHTGTHKRHHSRQQYIRGFKPYHEDRAPFQRRQADDLSAESRLPAFHKDNIIDPDLAQYLSDDASSGDEQQPSLLSVASDAHLSKSGGESEKATFGGFLAAMKKGRSAFGDRSAPSISQSIRDADEASVSSSRAVNLPRSSRRRNLSVASSVHRQSPRASRDSVFHQDSPNTPVHMGLNQSGFKTTRSSSMRGPGAPPVELNKASLEHVRKLLRQLLIESEIPHSDSWESALMPILLKTADEVDPDVQRGDDMDIRHYVKLKKIHGGRPSDTSYVSGLVFTKNLALKSMPRSILRPKILIITFPLEYARQQQHFMSLEPVIRQEREFLENLVSRISALHPNLLLVESNVSGLALDLLEKAGIAVAYNVKPSVIEAVSRCTQTRIVTSMDKLLTTKLHNDCSSFDVKTYVHGGRRKTYMYISGCPKELGCTIVLRGSDEGVLGKVKRITEFMVYVVYNLRLETNLMRDQFVKLPTSSFDEQKTEACDGEKKSSPPNVEDETEKGSIVPRSSQTSNDDKTNVDSDGKALVLNEAIEVPDDVPMATYGEDMLHDHKTKILSASPFVMFETPYLLMRTREMERRLAYLKRLRDQDDSIEQSTEDKSKPQKFTLITPEMVHESPHDAPSKVKEVLRAAHDAEYDRVLYHYHTQKRQWEAYVSGNSTMFDPYAHQNIVVLYSLVCTTTSVPCSGPDTFVLEFYNEHGDDESIFEPDCTLGQYVEDLCHTAASICTANGCEKHMFEHHRQYVHGDAQLSFLLQPYPSKLRGLQDRVLMWSCCKICGNETQVMPMSENTWKYSFGKYLEVSFWGRNLHARAGVCPHDVQRDHLRYFGFKNVALRIQYDKINLLEVVVPRPRVTWKVDNDLKLRNDSYTRTENRIGRFIMSVQARLKGINVESVVPELLDECRQEIEELLKKVNEDHVSLKRQLQEKYTESHYWEIIPLNEVLRAAQEKVVEWDTTFADFERNYFPSEKDIKRLATLQLKKIFLDKDATSVASDEALQNQAEGGDEATHAGDKPRMMRRMTLSPEKAQDVLVSVVEKHAGKNQRETPVEEIEPRLPENENEDSQLAIDAVNGKKASPQDEAVSQKEVRHLDLAVPSAQSDRMPLESDSLNRPLSNSDVSTVVAEDADKNMGELSSPRRPSPMTTDMTQESNPEAKEESIISDQPSTPPSRPSAIPRLAEGAFRRSGKTHSPPLVRAQSQPAHLLRERSLGSIPVGGLKLGPSDPNGPYHAREEQTKSPEKKLSERFGLSALKNGRFTSGHSLIPRSTPNKRGSSRVSNLAKHFEQLSREFEKERQRERRQRAARGTQSRAFPLASSKPIVEVYRNVKEAVEEREPPVDGEELSATKAIPRDESGRKSDELNDLLENDEHMEKPAPQEELLESFESDGLRRIDSNLISEGEPEGSGDENRNTAEDLHPVDSQEEVRLLPDDESIEFKDLAKHERTTLLKMLTNFWSERSASGWAALDYPLSAVDHVFADCDIIVREDEPSSLVAFALDSFDYKEKLASIQSKYHESEKDGDISGHDPDLVKETWLERALLRETGTHLKYQFQEGQAKMLCKVFYAEQFDALRIKCGVADRIVEALSRCAKWDSKGGKTKSLFLKTLDDRFVLKSLSPVETQAFLKFAPGYFQIMSEALFHELPSAIAKMFGFYQVIMKNPVTGTEFNWFLLLMENLFYDRKSNHIFDLKGSMRNRKVKSTGESDEVLLDENMVDFIYETPLFAREHSKKLLSQSVWNDTLFLGRQTVMDYSLMIAIDEKRSELVVGIIDCIRTYTWDKKLESWIKDRGFAGGGRNRPTVTSPKEYKSRFREAMARYVLQAPSCWHQFQTSAMYRLLQEDSKGSNAMELETFDGAGTSTLQ
ncbi:hypothetical protein N7492_004584 [Penicillium capsulatum]|uniref:1-phosphatidylinositol-3-phosphate 5-kinase n=1 Tax=Penicillium capsulatum TaxID=69766 RepID=A0A9W9IAJ3_9EURO|nr:hypothetical protein N7492_004584 [Penicillium capsulatum]KAJ6136299.1 hypothetical protein N7512_001459 [Penicillium capsulatum]